MIIDHDSSRRVTGCIGAIVNGVSHLSLKYVAVVGVVVAVVAVEQWHGP